MGRAYTTLKQWLALGALRSLRALFGARRTGPLDVFFAYRLLLGRSPDRDGWLHYVAAARKGALSLQGLANSLLASEEYRANRSQPHEHADYETRPVEEEVVSVEGCAIVIDRHDMVIGRAIREGAYEPATTEIVRRLVRSGHTVVDVGANVGFFTMLAARCAGPTGCVLAFEPAPHNFRLLQKSVALNGLTNVELHREALSDASGSVELIQWERRNSGSFHLINDPTWQGARYPAEARRFDDLFAGPRLDLVKIDVEGAEGLVLAGMWRAIERFRPVILFEYSPAAIADISRRDGTEALAELRARRYAIAEAKAYLRGAAAMSDRQITRLIRRRGTDHLDLVALPHPA